MTLGILIVTAGTPALAAGFGERMASLKCKTRVVSSGHDIPQAIDGWIPDAVVIAGDAVEGSDLDTAFLVRRLLDPHRPVIVVAENEKVLANDGKTFDPMRLYLSTVARLRAGNPHLVGDQISWPGLRIETPWRGVKHHDASTQLTRKEFELLDYLARRPDRIFTRRQLLNALWGAGSKIEDRSIDVFVMRLRRALRSIGLENVIQTVHDGGYGFRPPREAAKVTRLPARRPTRAVGQRAGIAAANNVRASPGDRAGRSARRFRRALP